MRIVLDTNVIVSGLLWGGPPRRLLDLARQNAITPYTSAVLLDELSEVLAREKFAVPLAAHGLTPNGILRGYAALAQTIAPPPIAPPQFPPMPTMTPSSRARWLRKPV